MQRIFWHAFSIIKMCAFDSWFASFHATFSNKLCCIKTGEKVKCRNTCSTYRAIAFAIAIADPGHALHVTSHIGHYTAGLLLICRDLQAHCRVNIIWVSCDTHVLGTSAMWLSSHFPSQLSFLLSVQEATLSVQAYSLISSVSTKWVFALPCCYSRICRCWLG